MVRPRSDIASSINSIGIRVEYIHQFEGVPMRVDQSSSADILRNKLDVIESLVDCMERVVQVLREKSMDTEANEFIQSIRNQRFQAMLLRGQLAAW